MIPKKDEQNSGLVYRMQENFEKVSKEGFKANKGKKVPDDFEKHKLITKTVGSKKKNELQNPFYKGNVKSRCFSTLMERNVKGKLREASAMWIRMHV